jgi:hypothetical protein
MQKHFWLQLIRWGSLTTVGVLGFWNIYQADAQSTGLTNYVLSGSAPIIYTQPNAVTQTTVSVRNTSDSAWNSVTLQLGTIFSTGDKNRVSAWKTDEWLSATRIGLKGDPRKIFSNRIVDFTFSIKAPERVGQYKEYFQLVDGDQWLIGEPIVITITVGDALTVQSTTEKEVRIYRKPQVGEWVENGFVVATLPISSGKSGYATPAGKYTIMNHIPNAYSSKYALWMPNWMGLSSVKSGFRGYGMHSLPYWKVNPAKYVEGMIYAGGRLYTDERLYEGFSHLGRPVSHGCVRWGIAESAILYAWAPNGTLVTVI